MGKIEKPRHKTRNPLSRRIFFLKNAEKNWQYLKAMLILLLVFRERR
jgi:hypothetical protein